MSLATFTEFLAKERFKLGHLKMVAANVGAEVHLFFENDRNNVEIHFVDHDDFLLEKCHVTVYG